MGHSLSGVMDTVPNVSGENQSGKSRDKIGAPLSEKVNIDLDTHTRF
jgi:hypothetical protein